MLRRGGRWRSLLRASARSRHMTARFALRDGEPHAMCVQDQIEREHAPQRGFEPRQHAQRIGFATDQEPRRLGVPEQAAQMGARNTEAARKPRNRKWNRIGRWKFSGMADETKAHQRL